LTAPFDRPVAATSPTKDRLQLAVIWNAAMVFDELYAAYK
jgi:hypothetical protein